MADGNSDDLEGEFVLGQLIDDLIAHRADGLGDDAQSESESDTSVNSDSTAHTRLQSTSDLSDLDSNSCIE